MRLLAQLPNTFFQTFTCPVIKWSPFVTGTFRLLLLPENRPLMHSNELRFPDWDLNPGPFDPEPSVLTIVPTCFGHLNT